MYIGFGTFERLLVRLFDLSETQRGALKGRFKYLQRLGALDNAPIGRGRTRYDVDDILRLVLVFEFIDIGCTPTHAVRMVRTQWGKLQEHLAHAWSDVAARAAGEATEGVLWTIVPRVLSEVGSADAMGNVTIVERAGDIEPAAVLDWPQGEALAYNRHAIFINLPQLLAACCEGFAGISPDTEQAFRRDLDQMMKTNRAVASM